jgi:hypothetical protein
LGYSSQETDDEYGRQTRAKAKAGRQNLPDAPFEKNFFEKNIILRI